MKIVVSKAKGTDVLGIKGLLLEVGLPIHGVDEALENFLVVRHEGRVVACGGIEVYDGFFGLMRSVAVAEPFRGQGIGERLVPRLIQLAKKLGAYELVLLTLDAVRYFEDFGFEVIDDDELRGSLRQSWVFDYHECDGSLVMWKHLI